MFQPYWEHYKLPSALWCASKTYTATSEKAQRLKYFRGEAGKKWGHDAVEMKMI